MSDTKAPRGPYQNVDGVIYCGELVIARMCIDRGPRTGDLLAAAPELLEALEALARQCQEIDTVMCQEALGTNLFIGEPSFQNAIAAIAKAKGESK